MTVQLAGATPSGAAQWWRTGSNAAITRQADVAFAGTSASLSLPTRSIGMLVRPGRIRSGRERRWNREGSDGGSDGGVPPAPVLGAVEARTAARAGCRDPVPRTSRGAAAPQPGGRVGVLALLLTTLAFTRRRS